MYCESEAASKFDSNYDIKCLERTRQAAQSLKGGMKGAAKGIAQVVCFAFIGVRNLDFDSGSCIF
jgi:hypothetical protein